MAREIRESRCRFCGKKNDGLVDYKDVSLLQKYCSAQGKMYDRKRMGTCSKHQRAVARAVKRARYLALLRYIGQR